MLPLASPPSMSPARTQGAQAQQSRGSSSQERKSKMPAASRSGGLSNAGGHGHHSKRNSGERVRGRVGRDGANWVLQNGYISPADAVQSEGGDEKRSAGVTGDGDGNASSSCGWRSNQRGMHQGEGLTRTATPLGLVGCTDDSNAGNSSAFAERNGMAAPSTGHHGNRTRKGGKQKRGAGGNANHLLQFQYEPRSNSHFSEIGDDEGTGRSRRGGGGGARKNSGVWGGGSSRGPMSKEQFLQASD